MGGMTEHPFNIRAQTMIFCSFLLARKVVQFREYKGLSGEVDQHLVVSLAASLWTDSSLVMRQAAAGSHTMLQ